MKSILKIIVIVIAFSLVGLSVPLIGCSESSQPEGTDNQIVTVQRGDLTIDIAAAGNLALSLKENLAFEIAGTVEEVLVKEGDSVEEGQMLAKLDTSEWDEELTNLEMALAQADINLKNAELALEQAEDSWLDSVSAGDKVKRLKKYLEWELEKDPQDTEEILRLQQSLREAWDNFFWVASGSIDVKEVTVKEMQLELAEAHFENAEEALEEALENSPEIIAPFDGFITKVNVEGGDEVLKGTVAVTIADPNEFEADILVSEMDILQIEMGGEAYVQVDAMQGMSLLAEVIHISPTATIQSGVVNYEVTVEVASLEEMIQEQAEEKLKQMPQAQGGQRGQVPTAIPEDFQLREGLTVTVSIIVDERNDVLLVPNSAITAQGWKNYVKVLSADGTIEERAITTGISNWQYTEVMDGLSEGEQVIVPQGTTTTPTTQQEKPPGKFIPRMGK